MRFLHAFWKERFSKVLALFTIGVLLGAVMTNLIIGYQLDRMHSEKADLKAQLLEKEGQIKALEDKVSEAKRWLIVQEIQINLTLPERNFPDNQHLQLELEKEIKNILKNIRGKKVSELDPLVIWNIIDERNLEILDYQFCLKVQGIIVSEKLVFYILVKYLDPVRMVEPVISVPL